MNMFTKYDGWTHGLMMYLPSKQSGRIYLIRIDPSKLILDSLSQLFGSIRSGPSISTHFTNSQVICSNAPALGHCLQQWQAGLPMLSSRQWPFVDATDFLDCMPSISLNDFWVTFDSERPQIKPQLNLPSLTAGTCCDLGYINLPLET